MNLSGSKTTMALASTLSVIGLAGCDAFAPLEIRCAAYFHQLSEADIDDGLPSTRTVYRRQASAFINRLPGNRADNMAAMRKVDSSIMADDGLFEQCERIIPLYTSLEPE